jgi:hypothetical protein
MWKKSDFMVTKPGRETGAQTGRIRRHEEKATPKRA